MASMHNFIPARLCNFFAEIRFQFSKKLHSEEATLLFSVLSPFPVDVNS